MPDLMEALPATDMRLVRDMAAAAGTTPDAMALEMVRAYLGLVRSAPDALPNNPLRRAAVCAARRR